MWYNYYVVNYIYCIQFHIFLDVQVFQGPGFSESGSRVWIQILEVAPKNTSGRLLLYIPINVLIHGCQTRGSNFSNLQIGI